MPEQGKLTKENAAICYEAIRELFDALPKSKRNEFLGHLNEIFLFLEAAKRELPSEVK
jgi:hypothetical protein